VIPRDFITEWRSAAPWTSDEQVEQDLVISRAIVEMFNIPELASRLAWRGGTALHKLYLTPASRYSDDIDLVQVGPEPIGDTLDALRKALDPWLGHPRRVFKEGNVRLVYRYDSEGEPSAAMRLKIEINTREHFSVLGIVNRRFEVVNRWFEGSAEINTYYLDELLGTKLRALYQRKQGRDIFDLWAASRGSSVDEERIVDCFQRYLDHDGLRVSRAEFEANLHEKLADPDFGRDIEPLLSSAAEWDQTAAANYLIKDILPLLPGEPWKGGG
jgi:predicted nucleotidyltransferase component of viral defense system